MLLLFPVIWDYTIVSAASLLVAKVGTPVLEARAATCTPVVSGSSSVDDVPAIQKAIQICSSGIIVIPAGSIYKINSAFSFAACTGCTF